jgi:hypothetical protein
LCHQICRRAATKEIRPDVSLPDLTPAACAKVGREQASSIPVFAKPLNYQQNLIANNYHLQVSRDYLWSVGIVL